MILENNNKIKINFFFQKRNLAYAQTRIRQVLVQNKTEVSGLKFRVLTALTHTHTHTHTHTRQALDQDRVVLTSLARDCPKGENTLVRGGVVSCTDYVYAGT